jgi:hypothetical protein
MVQAPLVKITVLPMDTRHQSRVCEFGMNDTHGGHESRGLGAYIYPGWSAYAIPHLISPLALSLLSAAARAPRSPTNHRLEYLTGGRFPPEELAPARVTFRGGNRRSSRHHHESWIPFLPLFQCQGRRFSTAATSFLIPSSYGGFLSRGHHI